MIDLLGKKIYILMTAIFISNGSPLYAENAHVSKDLSPSNKESDSDINKVEPATRYLAVSLIFAIYGTLSNLGRSSNSDNVKTTKVPSEFIGKSYILKAPYFIELNLPKGKRAHSASVYVADGDFVEFRNPCGNCLDSKRLERPIRLHYIPKGSKITVVDAFVLGYNFFKSDSDMIYLIIQDESGLRAEITTLGLKVSVLMEEGTHFDYHVSLLNLIEKIEANSYVDQVVCADASRGDARFVQIDPFKYSTRIERKIYRFIKDFDLKDQLEIMNFSAAKNKYGNLSCAQIKFKTINSISLYFYYAFDWGLSNDTYELDDYLKIQTIPLVPINYRDFIKMKDNEILNAYP